MIFNEKCKKKLTMKNEYILYKANIVVTISVSTWNIYPSKA